MANNPYKNKIVYNGTTLIDLTTDNVSALDVMSGKTFHLPTGQQVEGTGSGTGSIIISDTLDAHGGTIREITAVDLTETYDGNIMSIDGGLFTDWA